MFLFRKCLVVFPSIQESNEDIIGKMNEIEYELVESAELTLTDEQVGHYFNWFLDTIASIIVMRDRVRK